MADIILFSNSSTILSGWQKKIDQSKNTVTIKKESELKRQISSKKNENIILYDYNSLKDNFSKIATWIKEESLSAKIFLMSASPSFQEGYPLIQKDIKGYANIYLAKVHLEDAINAIENGGTWFYPEFINNLIGHIVNTKKAIGDDEDILSKISKKHHRRMGICILYCLLRYLETKRYLAKHSLYFF